LTNIFKSNNEIFYLTNNSPVQEKGVYDVILSPEFYWVKKVELPVKKVSAAKKLAESIFEGSLPSGEFAYDVSKAGDEFIIIAYDKDSISKTITQKFTKEAKVNSIYFAQNEFADLEDCCGIDRDSSLVNLNGLIMQVPRVCTESKREIGSYLNNKKLSNKKITLSVLSSSTVESKELYLFTAGFFILLASFALDWYNYKKATLALEDKRAEIISSNHLPRTSIQLNSIKKSLTKTFKSQKKIRDEVFAFNSINLKDGEYIDSINANTKESTIVIKVDSSAREAEIKSQISKKVSIKSSEFRDNFLIIKVAS
jgi:hypothetical protein